MTKEEQETVITWDRAGDTMNIYTADPFLIARLTKLEAYKVAREHRQGGKVVAVDFQADKSLCFLRSKPLKRSLTDEQRERLAESARKNLTKVDSEPKNISY